MNLQTFFEQVWTVLGNHMYLKTTGIKDFRNHINFTKLWNLDTDTKGYKMKSKDEIHEEHSMVALY